MSKLTKLLSLLLLVGFLAACGNNDNNEQNNNNNSDTSTNGATDNNKNQGANNGGDNGQGTATNGDQKVDVADDVANKIAELEEVDTAHVLVTENNAYVAVKAKNGNEGNKELEQKIGEKAREAGRDFNHVYVSLNPDFVERMSGYGNKIRAGEPIEGLYDEFKTTVQDIFPDAR